MKKIDCFAFEMDAWGGSCRIIKSEDYESGYCEKCKFYKTKEQLKEEEKKTQQRLERLGYITSQNTNV